MRRLIYLLLPVCVLAGCFIGIYFVTLPKPELPEFEAVQSALTVLEKYGYQSTQIANSMNYWHLGACFAGFTLSVMAYFWAYDYIEKRKILRVIDYVREINDKVYNLKLDENNERELSLLTNELYKTAVILQEVAEADQKRAKNLETALADISHQLRTPLTSLQIMLDNLYENPELDLATRQEFLRTAGRQAEQMSELVVTLLNLAKLDNGTLKMRPRTIEASALLGAVVDGLKILAEISEVRFCLTGDMSARLRIDLKWQAQALSNIVKNCIEHSPSGQTVSLAVTSNAVYTRIIIADSGDGISAVDLKHIFERFYKAKNAKSESVGIGLSFAKTLIEADNGQIRVKSKEGIGTRYEITYYKTR